MPEPKRFTLWVPENGAPLREPEDPQPGPIKMRAAPIGVSLVEDPPNPDAQILWRALKLSDRHKRAVLPERIARTQAGYRELISFRIEYEINGRSHLLPRPLPKGPVPGEPRAGRPWRVDAIRVVATLEPPAAPSATEEIVMGVDVAFVDPYGNEPPSRLMLTRRPPYTTADVDDVARLMTQGFCNPWPEADDDTSETQYKTFRAECHETAANLLQPRAEALQLTAERRVRAELENRLRNGEHLTIEVHQEEDHLAVTARAGLR